MREDMPPIKKHEAKKEDKQSRSPDKKQSMRAMLEMVKTSTAYLQSQAVYTIR